MPDDTIKPKAVIGMLPLFPDKAASPAMMKHAMNPVMHGTQTLNPCRTPVIGADCNCSGHFQISLAMTSWLWWWVHRGQTEPDGRKGHPWFWVEWNTFSVTGSHFRWGKDAKSVLYDYQLKRTRYAHQVSVMALYLLRQKSYSNYCSIFHGPLESIELWAKKIKKYSTLTLIRSWKSTSSQ